MTTLSHQPPVNQGNSKQPIRMLLTKQNIPILNGDFVLPKIKDMNIRQTLADLCPEPPASLSSKQSEPRPASVPVQSSPGQTGQTKPAFILSDIRRAQNSGIKFVQLVLEQPKKEPQQTPIPIDAIKQEKFCKTEVSNETSSENICTICGETVPEKSAFNAHIRAHLKEKLSNRMKKNQEIKTEPRDVDDKRTQPVKRKSTCSPEKQPARMKIKMEIFDTLPEMDTPSPEVPSFDPVDDSFLSQDFSREIEDQRVDLNNDLSMILDQIEKDFDSGPGSNMTDVNLDTPPESDSDSDIFNFLQTDSEDPGYVSGLSLSSSRSSLSPMMMVPPRLAESSLISDDFENLLNQTASDHDYLLNSSAPAPLPSGVTGAVGGGMPARGDSARDTNNISPSGHESNISKVLISTSSSQDDSQAAPTKTFAIVNHTTGKVFIQREGAPVKTVTMFKPGTGDRKPINIEGFREAVSAGGQLGAGAGMTNANIIETTKGVDGEKEYKLVLGSEGIKSKVKTKQTADCNICGKSITTKNMARHMEKHTGKKKFQCNICQASFFQKTHLKNHVILHENGDSHECLECKQRFLRRADLQKHLKTEHCTEVSCFCNPCGLRFSEPQTLDLHYKNSQCTEKLELCGVCGEKFKDKEAMIVHMQTHTLTTTTPAPAEKPFSCKLCSKTFVQKGHLNRHLKNHHGSVDLVCLICNKQCRNQAEMGEHRASCHAPLPRPGSGDRQRLQSSVSSVGSGGTSRSDFNSLLSPGSLSSHDFEFFEEESNGSTIFSQSPVTPGLFPPSDPAFVQNYSESTRLDSLEDNFSSFLNDFDSDSPLINDSISGDKSFSTSLEDTRPSLTFQDISDASFFDISSQLDENIYDADLFATMK